MCKGHQFLGEAEGDGSYRLASATVESQRKIYLLGWMKPALFTCVSTPSALANNTLQLL